MYTKAVRGAIQLDSDTSDEMEAGVQRLVLGIMKKNGIEESSLVSIQFTQTDDLRAENPARVLRKIGFSGIPLFCSREPEYPGCLPRMVRVLVTVNRNGNEALKPIYLDGAVALRPDLVSE